MKKNKNAILLFISAIMFLYIGLLTVYPKILTQTFNVEKFNQKAYKATGLVTSVNSVEYETKPDLTLIVTIRKWSAKYIDMQDCFDADLIVLKTNLTAPFTKNFEIKNLFLKNVKFSNQILMPQKVNKLAYLPRSFDSAAFGTNKIKIKPGPVQVKNFRIKNIAPGYYKEDNRDFSSYTKMQVKDFLTALHIRYVDVK